MEQIYGRMVDRTRHTVWGEYNWIVKNEKNSLVEF